MGKKFTLNVEEGETGLWFITSDDIGEKQRLFASGHSLKEVLASVPGCMTDLAEATVKPSGKE